MRTSCFASLVVALVGLCSAAARADSPLTSTDLAAGYDDVAGVARAHARNASPHTGGIVADDEDIAFLLGDAPSDHKLALVSALGWGARGSAKSFVAAVARRVHVPLGDLAKKNLRPVDKAVLGYLLAMDDYFDLSSIGVGNDLQQAKPQKLLAEAKAALPGDFAIAYVHGLIVAQQRMQGDWCQIYKGMQKIVDGFPEEKRNLRPAAVAKSQEYIALYRDNCADLKPPPEHAEELNQIYSVTRLGRVLVIGTQGGVVAFDTSTNKRTAVAVDFICDEAVVHEDAVFVGCRRHAYRFDGKSFTRIWTRERRDATDGIVPLRRADGTLVMLEGRKAARWVAAQNKLVADGPAEARGAYHRCYAPDGVLWSIDFLNAVVAGKTRFARSGPYPGRDPRKFVVDGRGRMWILDFDDGVFRVEGSRFTKVAGVDDKGSGVAVDDARERTWLLHYTKGLVLQQQQTTTTVPLPDAEFMRAMMLDEDGTVWVGGWHGLVRVTLEQGQPASQIFALH